MLVQPTQKEGTSSERLSETHPTPSPETPLVIAPNEHFMIHLLLNLVRFQIKPEIKLLKAKITKLKKKANPVIKHFKAYQKRISKEQRQQRKRLSKKKKVQIESVSKQGRKNAKGDRFKAKENDSKTSLKVLEDKGKGSRRGELKVPLSKEQSEEEEIEEEDETICDDVDISSSLLKNEADRNSKLRSFKSKKKKEDTKEEVKDEDKDKESTRKRKLVTGKTVLSWYKIHSLDESKEGEIINLNVGIERVLWGDLKVLFKPDEQDEFWSSQHEWKVISWKLHSSSGVHTLMTNEGVVIHMLTEKKYPLKKEILVANAKFKIRSVRRKYNGIGIVKIFQRVLDD
ncbi:hypothetical protein Tco_1062572 [Tanacetum coccineum]